MKKAGLGVRLSVSVNANRVFLQEISGFQAFLGLRIIQIEARSLRGWLGLRRFSAMDRQDCRTLRFGPTRPSRSIAHSIYRSTAQSLLLLPGLFIEAPLAPVD